MPETGGHKSPEEIEAEQEAIDRTVATEKRVADQGQSGAAGGEPPMDERDESPPPERH